MGQLGNQWTEPEGLWGQPTLSPHLPLPPPSLHTRFRPSRGGWRPGLESPSCTLCCVCGVCSACDRVLPFCLAVAPPPPLQTFSLSRPLRYCLKTPSPRKNKYD
ncbi:unnamed protein product [Rangifer tarandus platyrhynchus]|uniref:Uncharacterized protein n=1 Tax=Rangifer tarandus platyrhynchus TaxID=3082113 RepID=A0ABN9A460_RANTA|nr:unnamed protein product [Rangifer tarandus platyrhynchus]